MHSRKRFRNEKDEDNNTSFLGSSDAKKRKKNKNSKNTIPAVIDAEKRMISVSNALHDFFMYAIQIRNKLQLLPVGPRGRHAWCYETTPLRPLLPTLQTHFYPQGMRKPSKQRCSSDTGIGKTVDKNIENYFRTNSLGIFQKYDSMLSCIEEVETKLHGASKSSYQKEYGIRDEEVTHESLDVSRGELLGKDIDESDEDERYMRKLIDRGDKKAIAKEKRRTRAKKLYFRAACDALRKEGIILAAVQVPLCDPDQKIISFIDAIGLDLNKGCIVIIEFKTGYDYAYKWAKTKMNVPLDKISCSPKNMHQLQIGWYHDVCTRVYGMRFNSPQDTRLLKVNAKNVRVGKNGKESKGKDGNEEDLISLETSGEWQILEKWTVNSLPQMRNALNESSC